MNNILFKFTLHLYINKVLSDCEVIYMNIVIKNNEPNVMYVQAEGKLDLKTAVKYGTTVKDAVEDSDTAIKELILDFSQITFISSLGLKIILDLVFLIAILRIPQRGTNLAILLIK